MLNAIRFVGYVKKSKFLNLGYTQHYFHYKKNVLMIGIAFLIVYDTQCSICQNR